MKSIHETTSQKETGSALAHTPGQVKQSSQRFGACAPLPPGGRTRPAHPEKSCIYRGTQAGPDGTRRMLGISPDMQVKLGQQYLPQPDEIAGGVVNDGLAQLVELHIPAHCPQTRGHVPDKPMAPIAVFVDHIVSIVAAHATWLKQNASAVSRYVPGRAIKTLGGR